MQGTKNLGGRGGLQPPRPPGFYGPESVKLRFLLISENMLKSIATARSECTAKHENKANFNTDYIVPDLIDFFGDD